MTRSRNLSLLRSALTNCNFFRRFLDYFGVQSSEQFWGSNPLTESTLGVTNTVTDNQINIDSTQLCNKEFRIKND